MKIQKICLLALCVFIGSQVSAGPGAPGSAPVAAQATSAIPTNSPMTMMAPTPVGHPAGHEEGFLENTADEKRKEDFLTEVVKDEQQIAQMAKEFDVRLSKIENTFAGICNNTAPHHEGGSPLSMQHSGPNTKLAGPAMGPESPTPFAAPQGVPAAGPSGPANPGAFPPSPAPQK